ncbi:DUF5011 domain-containing protein [Mediterraneibacter sp. NSJ-55]|uniref:DUF5011 domain-containing protein n=1 Tax=Mediterraneibacter hominis TaxID=2763054 RepID=A0A923LH61_9FIRM|nr:carbohydrate binding domain-containing protein [Mediterraneibacter hominis]MBC5687981.1 DUF5011 domain-containing protein [Mediterraneibacter hominis]
MKKKILAGVMALMLTAGSLCALPLTGSGGVAYADTTEVETPNMVGNPGFEEDFEEIIGKGNVGEGKREDAKWYSYPGEDANGIMWTTEEKHDGTYAVKVSKAEDALEQDFTNLTAGATYEASCWAKKAGTGTIDAKFNIKGHLENANTAVKAPITDTEWKQYTHTFTAESTNVRMIIYVESASNGAVYVDDFSLKLVSDIESVDAENGEYQVKFNDSYTGTPDKEAFQITYDNASTGEAVSLEVTDCQYDAGTKTATLTVEKIPEAVREQRISGHVLYVPHNQNIDVSYTVDANGEEEIIAQMASVSAENGKVTVVLDKTPSMDPEQSQFTLKQTIDNAQSEACEITSFAYNKEEKTVTLGFEEIPYTTEDKTVEIEVIYTYAEQEPQSMQAEFTVSIGDGRTFYVSAEGNDENDGRTEDTAWATLERVNEEVFRPGDKILFRRGDTFEGGMKPQGSGIEGAPIQIDAYGEAEDAPVIMPPEESNPTVDTLYVQNRTYPNTKSVSAIAFKNQNYWEVRNLELYDDTYEKNVNYKNDSDIFHRGIWINGEDYGAMKHFIFENLEIHGFRGPSHAQGKCAGGIIVTISGDDVPTHVDGLEIRNCELYKLGRSGINLATPWTTRKAEDGKWGWFTWNGLGDWIGHEDMIVENCTIHDIDGDATIINNTEGAVYRNNTIYRTCLNAQGLGYAVGVFNWNADNTIIEENEVFDTAPDDRTGGNGDAQGIEIDALNDTTYVQYNYIHDNPGGTFMFCNLGGYPGYNGVYRYNIMQNDGTAHGVFDMRDYHVDSQVYNNLIYYDRSEKMKFSTNYGGTHIEDMEIYNNVWIFLSDTPMEEPQFNANRVSWTNNVFVGYDKIPVAGENNKKLEQADVGQLGYVAPGTGKTGMDTLAGYNLKPDSILIDAGLNTADMTEGEDNGGRDFFGNELDETQDIGPVEYVKSLVTAASENEEMGTVSVEGEQYIGSEITLTASPKAGYHFVKWVDEEKETVSTEMSYTFTLTESVNLTAVFEALIEEEEAPVIYAQDKTIYVGDKFDALEGVTASAGDEDLTAFIEVVKNTVDTTKADVYEVQYRVQNKAGITAEKTITVTVKEKSGAVTPEEPDKPGKEDKKPESGTAGKEKEKTAAVKTGDSAHAGVWGTVMALALAGCAVSAGCVRRSRRKK